MQQIFTKVNEKKAKIINEIVEDTKIKSYGRALSKQGEIKDKPEETGHKKINRAVAALQVRREARKIRFA